MNAQFVHLQIHSEYSLIDGTVRIGSLCERIKELGMPAVALTDVANTYGMVKFYRKCITNGIKPIIGVHAWTNNEEDRNQPHQLLLLCRDNDGYRALCELLSRAYLNNSGAGSVNIELDWMREHADGFIVLAGGVEGAIGQALITGYPDRAQQHAREYQELFGDRFYIDVSRTGREHESDYVSMATRLAASLDIPVVATNAVQFLTAAEFDAHEVRVCINEGRVLSDTRRQRRFTEQQYLRSTAEMSALFADMPEALTNTVEIAKRCNVVLTLDKDFLPHYPLAKGMTAEKMLNQTTMKGLLERLRLPDENAIDKTYHERLQLELDVINRMGFAGYFLIVADFIRWAKEHAIPVGPGRGSGAGSLVAYAIGITELDPIEHGLLFERFLNPERVSLPDFDIDFCMEGRDHVIEYVADKYGRDQVAQIITHGTMAARAVVRDVGRVMDMPYGFVDTLAKLVPFAVGMTLDDALTQEPLLKERYDNEDDVRECLDTARSLEGLARNVGKHAGGVVIAPTALTDFTPLYFEPGMSQPVTQLDKDDLETIGLVKFDFLGLRTLTIIDSTLRTINQDRERQGEAPLDLNHLPMDDVQTFDLVKTGKTTALFQLESRGMQELIQRLQPDKFDDLVALVALFRPGPLQSGMVDDFINRKHGRERVTYPHPELENILTPTYGVILYQEQVMQIAQVLAGYSLGAADLLRRAMGKKKPEEMAHQRAVFLDGSKKRGVDTDVATHIFNLMEKFAGYGFNKSHSAAYAMITYQTAWLKTHHTAAFMAAALSSDMDHTDKVVVLMAECRDLKLQVAPPDINRCEYHFVPVGQDRILYGLGAIKGVGRSALESVLAARDEAEPFTDLFDLCARIDSRKVNRRTLEALIKSGGLDELGRHRAALMAALPGAINTAEQQSQDATAGQSDMFGINAPATVKPEIQDVAEWSEEQRLVGERDTLGLYLSGHPYDRYRDELKQIIETPVNELNPTVDRSVWVAGLIVAIRTLNTQRGRKMAFVTVDDKTARIEISIMGDLFNSERNTIRKDNVVAIHGQVSVDDYSGGFQMRAEKIYDIENLRALLVARITVETDEQALKDGLAGQIHDVLGPYTGGRSEIVLSYRRHNGQYADIQLGPDWKVKPAEGLINSLEKLFGRDKISLIYDLRLMQNNKPAQPAQQQYLEAM